MLAVKAATLQPQPNGEYETQTQSVEDAGAAPAVPARASPGRNHCRIREARFLSIPSGNVPPTLTASTFQAPFPMSGSFSSAIPCTCSVGVYRQRVSGTLSVNGTAIAHPLLGTTMLHPTNLQEDGTPAGDAYGHRERPGWTGNQYLRDHEGGCLYAGTDAPGIARTSGSFPSGTALAVNLSFEGTLQDTSEARTLATATWTVIGSAVAP